MTSPGPVLEIKGVSRNYQGLRPLRLKSLRIAEHERVSISGVDTAEAELIVNLVTGATLPDQGDVRVFGRSTAAISGGDEWLASLDRFGIVSDRAILLERATLQQNLAMPFTLEIDPVPVETAARVARLAEQCGIDAPWLERTAGELPADVRARAHLARAIALEPALLLVEHPTAQVPGAARTSLAEDFRRACETRGLAALVLTNDEEFARTVAPRNLRLHGATGELKIVKGFFR